MSAFRHTSSRRLLAVLVTVLAVLAAALLVDASVALELAPGLLLLGLALAGWMPCEARLVRAMRRRRSDRRSRPRAALPPRRGQRVVAVSGRVGASCVALRGPPLVASA